MAQNADALIVGTVHDASQAVVPGVKISVLHVATGQSFATQTNANGDYVLSGLPVGEYRIQAEAANFETSIRNGVVLEVGRTIRIDFSLSIGRVSQKTVVSGEAPLVDTEGATVGQVIGNRQVEALPLNGRDWLSLATLVPSVLPTANNIQGGGIHALNFLTRGLRRSDNVVYLNGALIIQGNGGTTFYPNIDAIQEFQIKSGLYGAEFGMMPGVQIVAVTKSGTNQLHGDLFEFLRNDKLDARNFFEQTKKPFKRNEYGGTVGGPIHIPGVWNGKDKAWFFVSYQMDSIRQFAALTGVVPTDKEKQGIFPSTIIDPNTGLPFPNNTIPPDRISAISQKFLQFWPQANTPGPLNFTSPNTSIASDNPQWMSRADFDTSQNDRWMAQFIWASNPFDGPNPIHAFSFHLPLSTTVASLANTHTFSNKFVNEAGIHYYRRPFILEANNLGCDFSQTLGIPQLVSDGVDKCGVPIVNVQGFTGVGSFSVIGPVIVGNWFIKDHLSFQQGNHFLKTGIDFRRSFNPILEQSRSLFDFAGRYTGNGFADFLLGFPDFTRAGGTALQENLNQSSFYLYVQDEWRATPKLSLSLGLRYELRLPWKDKYGFSTNFDPATGALNPALNPQTGLFPAGQPLVRFSASAGFMPRIGLAYRLTDKTVVRGGYGIYAGEPIVGMIQQLGANPRPGTAVLTYHSGLTKPTITFSDPFPAGSGTSGGVPSAGGVDTPITLSRTHDWGIDVERELARNWLVDVGYEGSRTYNQTEGVGLNDAPPGPGTLQPRRPYPNFGYMSFYKADGDAWYDGLNIKVVKRAGSDGLALLAGFTWSKAIDTADSRLDIAGEPEDRSVNISPRQNKALSSGNIGRRLVLTADYQLPFGRGKAYITRGLASKLAGGWSVQGIATLSDGVWVTMFLPGDTLNVGSGDSQWPDKICNPNLSASQRTLSRWFNTSCFATPGPFTYGNAGRSTVEGPGIINLDFAVHREFRITERQGIQFRAEAFNILNHPNFLIPGNQFGTASFGVIGGAQDPRQIQFGLKYIF
jgi:outer membrane receptor protein involved in Fe transport